MSIATQALPPFSEAFTNPSVRTRLETILQCKDDAFSSKMLGRSYLDKFSDSICSSYIREMRIRWALRRFVAAWIVRKIDKKTEPALDIITLQAIQQPIHVYCISTRRRYDFEAKELSRLIRSNLLYQSGSFPQPQYPKNSFTNKTFTYVQMISICQQLEQCGYMSWPLALFKEYDFRIERFTCLAHRPLIINAIEEELFDVENEEGQEMLMNFIETVSYSADFPISDRKREILEAAMHVIPHHPIMASLRSLAFMELESGIIGKNIWPFLTISASALFDKWHLIKNHPLVKRRLLEIEEEEDYDL